MIRAIALTLILGLAFEAVSAKKVKGNCVDGQLEGSENIECECPTGCSSCKLKGKKGKCTSCVDGFSKKGSKCKADEVEEAPLAGTCTGGNLSGGKGKCRCSNKDCQTCDISINDGKAEDVCTACKKGKFMIDNECTSKCKGDGLFKYGSKKAGVMCTKAFTCTGGVKEGSQDACKCYDSKCASCMVTGSSKKSQECLMCKDDSFQVQKGGCKKPKGGKEEKGESPEDNENETESPVKVKPTKTPKKKSSKAPKPEVDDSESPEDVENETESPEKVKPTKTPKKKPSPKKGPK